MAHGVREQITLHWTTVTSPLAAPQQRHFLDELALAGESIAFIEVFNMNRLTQRARDLKISSSGTPWIGNRALLLTHTRTPTSRQDQ